MVGVTYDPRYSTTTRTLPNQRVAFKFIVLSTRLERKHGQRVNRKNKNKGKENSPE